MKLFYGALLLSLIMPSVFASSMQIGRYQTVSEKPSFAQQQLLSQTIEVRFPQNIQTIGAAMDYILRYSGYSLVSYNQMNRAFQNTLAKPLPMVDRHFGPMSLRDALTTLAGPAFVLVDDPLNRTVNFQVKAALVTRTHLPSKPALS